MYFKFAHSERPASTPIGATPPRACPFKRASRIDPEKTNTGGHRWCEQIGEGALSQRERVVLSQKLTRAGEGAPKPPRASASRSANQAQGGSSSPTAGPLLPE